MLDMNPLRWLGRKTSTQTNKLVYIYLHVKSMYKVSNIYEQGHSISYKIACASSRLGSAWLISLCRLPEQTLDPCYPQKILIILSRAQLFKANDVIS